ncbi:hypothetical protein GCM10027185_15220 [Spirosoma pulveris]
MIPVLLFAYANDKDEQLPALELEKKAIAASLNPLKRANLINFEDNHQTTESLADALLKNQRVCVFHFAGHANSRQLLFEDQRADIKGIVPMLKLQKQLFLVVLNGCSTASQVKRLLDIGIPAVVATRRPVNDRLAQEFAQNFYASLAESKTLTEAFEFALARRSMNESNLEISATHRGIKLITQDGQADELAWELSYLPERKREVEQWVLPRGDEPVREPEENVLRLNDEVNESLVETLSEIVQKYQPDKLIQAGGSRSVQKVLFESLPYPIGVQIRELLATDLKNGSDRLSYFGTKRLLRLVNAFEVITELLLYVLMAQLWKGMHEQKSNFELSDSCRTILRDYFNRSSGVFRKTDVLPIIRAIREVLVMNQVTVFVDEIDELKNLVEEDIEFKEAYGFLQVMKQAKYDNQLKASYCKDAERQFINLLRRVGFITRYKLLNIREIFVIKRRALHFGYNHIQIALDHRMVEEFAEDVFTSEDCYDDHSILLIKNEEIQLVPSTLQLDKKHKVLKSPTVDYLNLSPFVIDNNSLKEEQDIDMLFFECYDNDRNVYIYKQIENLSNEIAIPDMENQVHRKRRVGPVVSVFEEFVNAFNSNGHGKDTE